MFANAIGEGVMPGLPVDYDHDSIERARDLAMLAMHRQRVPLRVVAQFFGVAKSTAWKRIQAIPDAVRNHHGARSLV